MPQFILPESTVMKQPGRSAPPRGLRRGARGRLIRFGAVCGGLLLVYTATAATSMAAVPRAEFWNAEFWNAEFWNTAPWNTAPSNAEPSNQEQPVYRGESVVAGRNSSGGPSGWTTEGGGTTGGDGTVAAGEGDCGSQGGDAEAVLSGETWTATRGDSRLYEGSDMVAAVQEAVDSLSHNRTQMERVVVRGSGSMDADSRIALPSYTSLDVCGTINVTGTGSGDKSPIMARSATDVEVLHAHITGTPTYGIFMRSVSNLHLGQIELALSSGLGVRIDNFADKGTMAKNTKIDHVVVSGTSDNGVETYGLDGLTIGTVTARNVGHAGLLLNRTINASVDLVEGEDVGSGTGYATFRTANDNGEIDNEFPTNIRVKKVVARGGGRGVFCVSNSGGLEIEELDIRNTETDSILVQNCHNVKLVTRSGVVEGRGGIRVDSPVSGNFEASTDVSIENLTVKNSRIRVTGTCTSSIQITQNDLDASTVETCSQ